MNAKLTHQKLAVLKLQGDLERGFQVSFELRVDSRLEVEVPGELPASAMLLQAYQDWQTAYRDLGQTARTLKPKRATLSNIKQRKQSCFNAAQSLRQALNQWLKAERFIPIREAWLRQVTAADLGQVIIRSQVAEIWQLPWQQWEFLQDYDHLEISFSSLQTHSVSQPVAPLSQQFAPKTLVVLGDATGLNLQKERDAFEKLGAWVEVLPEPKRKDLIDHLRNHAYSFLFFAGHSHTEQGVGFIDLNPTDSLTLEELRSTLKQAIQNGLQLAIFNSCDGLGLIKALEPLQISHLIVMREPIPDAVAQVFLQVFLQKFSGGTAFHLAVREAREELKKTEDDFPCASWLPLVWQSPSAAPLSWPQMLQKPAGATPRRVQTSPHSLWRYLRIPLAIALATAVAVMGLRTSGWLQPAELAAFDQIMQMRPNEGSDANLLIIEITDQDIQDQRQNGELMQRTRTTEQHKGKSVNVSLSDYSLERILEKLARPEYQPLVIGLDIYRDFPVIPQQPKLNELLKNLPVFAICKAENLWKSGIPTIDPPPELPKSRIGFSDFETDPDGTLRRHWLSMAPSQWSPHSGCTSINADNSFNAFSTQVAFAYLNKKGIPAEFVKRGNSSDLKLSEKIYSVLRSDSGGYQNLPISGNQLMLNYRASKEIAPRISLSQFLTNQINPDFTQDKIVLIGGVPTNGSDYWKLPSAPAPIPGVRMQAEMISQLVNAALPDQQRPLIWVWNLWQDRLWILGWTTVGSLIVWLVGTQNQPARRLWLRFVLAIFLSGSVLYSVCFAILLRGGWMPLVPAAIGLALAGGVIAAYLSQQSQKSSLPRKSP